MDKNQGHPQRSCENYRILGSTQTYWIRVFILVRTLDVSYVCTLRSEKNCLSPLRTKLGSLRVGITASNRVERDTKFFVNCSLYRAKEKHWHLSLPIPRMWGITIIHPSVMSNFAQPSINTIYRWTEKLPCAYWSSKDNLNHWYQGCSVPIGLKIITFSLPPGKWQDDFNMVSSTPLFYSYMVSETFILIA